MLGIRSNPDKALWDSASHSKGLLTIGSHRWACWAWSFESFPSTFRSSHFWICVNKCYFIAARLAFNPLAWAGAVQGGTGTSVVDGEFVIEQPIKCIKIFFIVRIDLGGRMEEDHSYMEPFRFLIYFVDFYVFFTTHFPILYCIFLDVIKHLG